MNQIKNTLDFDPNYLYFIAIIVWIAAFFTSIDHQYLYLIAIITWGLKSYIKGKHNDLILFVLAFLMAVGIQPGGLIGYLGTWGGLLSIAVFLKMSTILGENAAKELYVASKKKNLPDYEILVRYGEVLELLPAKCKTVMQNALPEEFLPCEKKKLEDILTRNYRRLLNGDFLESISNDKDRNDLKLTMENGLLSLPRFIPFNNLINAKRFIREECTKEEEPELRKMINETAESMRVNAKRYSKIINSI